MKYSIESSTYPSEDVDALHHVPKYHVLACNSWNMEFPVISAATRNSNP